MQQYELEDDKLVIPDIGWWAKKKYHFLENYLKIVSKAMKDKWPHRQYLDLFSGAGIARIKGTGELVMTSSLIAASVDNQFSFLHLCERDQENCIALESRLRRYSPECKFKIYQGDANDCIDQVMDGIPKRNCLAVAFVDPFGLHFDYETARKLSTRKVDLIVLLADNMDAMRNWKKYYESNPESNLDRFIGESGWRDAFNNSPTERLPEKFRLRYIEQLKKLGYQFFETTQVQNTSNRDIYTLLYATEHPLGLKFWDEARAIDEKGQRNLF